MQTLIKALTDKIQPGWFLTVDGQPMPVRQSFTLIHEKMGMITYGKSPSGDYDQWAFHEAGGGGSVIIPFTATSSRKLLSVGVVLQPRPLQSDQPVANVPRGFMDPGKDHFQTASSELAEEMGLAMPIINLGGEGGNPNSTFFETWGKDEGIHFWGVEVPYTLLVAGENGQYGFKPGVVKPVEGDKTAERILGSKFISWIEAARLGDMMTNSAVARLLAYLASR